jgi:predicted nuclease of predicted toxin-antitoxin system
MSESIQIVIDESVDYAIVTALKKAGFSIFVIADETPSIPDNKVLEIAFTNSALLITEDKDFGELAFRFQLKHSGILLVRMIEAESKEKADEVIKSVKLYFEDMLNNFSVLDNRKLRIRK